MIVLKFGGTSMGSAEGQKNCIEIVSERARGKKPIVVIVSAFSRVTDTLQKIARKAASRDESYREHIEEIRTRHLQAIRSFVPLERQPSSCATMQAFFNDMDKTAKSIAQLRMADAASLDAMMAYGELLSSQFLADALTGRGVKANALDTRTCIITDDSFGSARIKKEESYTALRERIAAINGVAIVTGFIAATADGRTTTLGRGGSDYTASLFGAALDASVIEIWTDVNGVLTADPRIVRDAVLVPTLTYREALELSHFGAKVIYPPTMMPALEKQIPVKIKNTFRPDAAGTCIQSSPDTKNGPIKGISSLSDITLIRVEGPNMIGHTGCAERIFRALARELINIVLITQASSEYSICIGIHNNDAQKAHRTLETEFALEIQGKLIHPIVVEPNKAIVTIVGEHMKKIPGTAGRLFRSLGENGINTIAIAQGSSEFSISVVVESQDESRAVAAIHDAFFCAPTAPNINVFLVGTGLIGSKLLEIINTQQIKGSNPSIRVCGIANSKHTVIARGGIDLSSWQAILQEGKQTLATDYIDRVASLALPHSVFVDCTASEDVPTYYEHLINKDISVVTPNKKGVSGPKEMYTVLHAQKKRRGGTFLYETTVGAGLPVIGSLRDLLACGDTVISIEAMLSGTLGYLFSTFCAGNLGFSEIVREAKMLGYTEPDPRDDLNGLDVARKILILARECGSLLELKEVRIDPFLPPECFTATSQEEFFALLEKLDPVFDEQRQKARASNTVLRCIARFEKDMATVKVCPVDATSPFYSLSGSDNMVVFSTQRYDKQPLVIRGPGAGADVTAAGVLADILKTMR
ncbi:bifunctional aspartate kinase/homoserine dehydrogenase I [Candidatus Uhrbacteria bacterium]|nr:bifunctional aspartate kinase/homoserine dehydrogenase I [Candidatus Uhrbacteria bacterium]